MTPLEFQAFAHEAKMWRRVAAKHEKEGDQQKATYMYTQALCIENTVVKVAKQFNFRFDVSKWRQSCNPDLTIRMDD